MTTNPITDADEYIASLFAKQEARQAAVDAMADDFRAAAVKCDANALVPWAGTVIDHEQRKALGIPGASADMPQRQQALHEVMVNALDYSHGPQMFEAMQLLLNVAHGADLANAPRHARDLLHRMGEAFGRVHSGVQ